MNVAKLDGGVAFNVIPDEATLTISVRPPPGTDVDQVRDQLYALALDVLPRAQLAVPMSNPSFHTRAPSAFAAALGAASPIDLAFWTEAALLADAGIDCVVYGPGDIAHAHAPDEFVPIADLERARDTFAAGDRGRGAADDGARPTSSCASSSRSARAASPSSTSRSSAPASPSASPPSPSTPTWRATPAKRSRSICASSPRSGCIRSCVLGLFESTEAMEQARA